MATYTIPINERTKAGKYLVAFLGSLKGVVSFSAVKESTALDEALTDVKKGKTFEAKNTDDLLTKCLA